MRRRPSKPLKIAFAGALGVVLLLVATLAMPVTGWRTGRGGVGEIQLAAAGEHAGPTHRLWIDTDAACGAGRTVDPDDCLALLALLRSPRPPVAGVSTVFGNASLEVADRTANALILRLAAEGYPVPTPHRGAEAPRRSRSDEPTPAEQSLRRALRQAPLTILALGPLTNVAGALSGHPELLPQVRRVVAVMGQRPGHIFHPVEGGTAGMLLGHGPVFRDFNFAQDPAAAGEILALGVPLTLIPYDAARRVVLTGSDLETIGRSGPAGRWVAERSSEWLRFWREDIRQDGFFPFDLAGAGYILHPDLYRCAEVKAWVGRRPWFLRWLIGESGLFVAQEPRGDALYCPAARAGLHHALISDLAGPYPAGDRPAR